MQEEGGKDTPQPRNKCWAPFLLLHALNSLLEKNWIVFQQALWFNVPKLDMAPVNIKVVSSSPS